jgi:hypothetical protein
MNVSYNLWHVGNTYGLFGRITRDRLEVIIEGTRDAAPGAESTWTEYEFKAKPGRLDRRPRQVAPYHLRLDWLMWFLPLSPGYGQGWFVPFLGKLLDGDRATLALLHHDPFDGRSPRYVRARLEHFRFTTWRELRETGAWWVRTPAGDFVGPVRRTDLST